MVCRRKRSFSWYAAALLLLVPAFVFALNDGAARTPPMGFNTWNFFGCNNINQNNVFNVAKAICQTHNTTWKGQPKSLREAGYVYINLDDCWHASARKSDGTPTWNTSLFPNGLPWLCDTIHKMGLKMGIYSDCGTATCAGKFATVNASATPAVFYDTIDARVYLEWGFEYLKFDWCNINGPASSYNNAAGCATLYSKMGHALWAAADTMAKRDTSFHRRIIFSLCQWGNFSVWNWADTCGHLWRTTGDINASWSSIYNNWNSNVAHYANAKPGAWNDPDMLEIGNGSLTATQNQAHMDMWCICAAPLLMGNNTANMSDAVFNVLSNAEVIAIDQDSLGYQGRRVRSVGNVQIITKALKVRAQDTVNNRKWAAVVLNNNSSGTAQGSVTWADIGETNNLAGYRVRNLWSHAWIRSRNVTDTTTGADSMTTLTDSVFSSAVPFQGTFHVLLVKGNPDAGFTAVQSARVSAPQKIDLRMRGFGHEVYMPTANSSVKIFNLQGRLMGSVMASKAGWCSLPSAAVHGTCMVKLETETGSVSRVVSFAK